MIQIQAALTIGNVSLKDNTMRTMVKYFDGAHQQFERAALKVHRKTVFEILIYLIRLTPVVTGRLRGSWTPFLDRWGKQSFYARYLNDKALIGGRSKTILGRAAQAVGGMLGMGAVDEGKRLGFFTDGGLLTTVGTNVVYAAKANESSKYLERSVAQAQLLINRNFEDFVSQTQKAGWIPDNTDNPGPQV